MMENWSSIMFIIFWDFLMVEAIFFSPQVKRSVIICNKLVYMSSLTSCRMTSRKLNMKILSVLAKSLEKQQLNFSRSTVFHMKTRVCLKYFVKDCRFHKKKLIFQKTLGKGVNNTGPQRGAQILKYNQCQFFDFKILSFVLSCKWTKST